MPFSTRAIALQTNLMDGTLDGTALETYAGTQPGAEALRTLLLGPGLHTINLLLAHPVASAAIAGSTTAQALVDQRLAQ